MGIVRVVPYMGAPNDICTYVELMITLYDSAHVTISEQESRSVGYSMVTGELYVW